MTVTRKLFLLAAAMMGSAIHGAATAGDYEFDGVASLCTGTCDSFASLDVESQLTGFYSIDTTPGGSWSFSDAGVFSGEVFNPSAPLEPFDGTNPTTANPLPIGPEVAPIVASGGGLTTGGMTDAANQLSYGNILQEFIVPPFSSNGAWLVFDIFAGGAAQMQVCLFFTTAGCIPGATQAMVVYGQFTLIPPPPIDFNDGFEGP